MPSFQLHDTCVESLWTNSKKVHEFPSMHKRHSTGQKEDKIVVYNSPLRSCLIQDSTSNLINEYMIKPLELDPYMSLNPQHKIFEITYKVWWWPWKTRFWKPSVNSMYFSEQRSDKDNSTQILTFSAYGRFIKKLQVPMHQYRWSWCHSSSASDQNKGFWGPLALLQYLILRSDSCIWSLDG
jgi:hypothetical protein